MNLFTRNLLAGFLFSLFLFGGQVVEAQISITSVDVVDETCAGADDGQLTVNISGGAGPFGYYVVFFSGTLDTIVQNTNVFAGIEPLSYNVYVIDSSDNSQDSLTVTVQPGINFFATGFNSILAACDTACNGRARALTLFGGNPKTYLWDDGATTQTNSALCGGLHTVTITEGSNGCQVSQEIVIPDGPAIYAAVDSTDSVTCNGGADGAAFLSAHGGYAASDSTTSYIIDQTENIYEPYPFNYSGATVYDHTTFTTFGAGFPGGDEGLSQVIDIGFDFEFFGNTVTQFRIHANGFITFDVANPSNSQCFNQSAIPGGGYPNNWIGLWEDLDLSVGGSVESYEIGSGAQQAHVVNFIDVPRFANNAQTQTYQIVLYESSNIVQIFSEQVIANAAVQGMESAGGTDGITATGRNNTPLNFTNDYVAFIPATQSFTYNWSSIGSGSSATNLTAGNYTVTVSDPRSCTTTLNFTIDEPAAITIDTTLTLPLCAGDANGSILASASGGNGGPFTYAWSNGPATDLNSNIAAGTYTVTVTDVAGCTETLAVTLPDPAPVTATITVDIPVDCNGASTGQLTANGGGGTPGYTFSWSTGSNLQTITSLAAGNYTVTVTDNNGCTGTASETITQPATGVTASITSSNDVSCFGGNDGDATAAGNGGTPGYTFSWSTGSANATINTLTAGTYSVTVTDNNGCTDSTSVVIDQPATGVDVTIASVSNILCNGDNNGSITADPATGSTGPYTYAWSNGSAGLTIGGLGAGTYTVTATDANGCTDTAQASITEPAVLNLFTNKTDETCPGASDGTVVSTIVGGTAPQTFLWSNGATTQNISSLPAGTYTITVTDANGCTATDSQTIDAGAAVLLVMDSIDAQCNGSATGSAMVTASGGTNPYTFAWNTGVTADSIGGLLSGTYTVTVTDASGCQATDDVTVNNGTGIQIGVSVVQDPLCAGTNTGSIAVTSINATPPTNTSYLWNTGATINILMSQPAGVYTVTLTDNNTGCQDDTTITLTDPPVLVATMIDSIQPSCLDNDGELEVEGTGGTPPYTFSWSNGGTSAQITGLPAATYTVTITDANNCTAIASSTLTAPAGFTASATMLEADTCGGSTGSATVNMVGGTLPFNFSWDNGQTTQLISSLAAGTYVVTVTDGDACTDTSSVTVIDTCSCTLVASGVLVNDVNCFNGSDGTAAVQTTGGVAPLTYAWSSGGSTIDTASNLAAGTYTVTVTAADGCTDTAQVTIGQPATAVSASITFTANPTCFGGSDGIGTVVASNGTGPYTFLWTSGATTATANNLSAGLNTVTVTDANGCTTTASTSIGTGTVVNAAFTNIQNSLCFVCNGSVTATLTGGTGPFTYSWSTGAVVTTNNTTNQQTGLCSGTYGVTITDANGCADSNTANIDDFFTPQFTLTPTPPTCAGSCDGQIIADYFCFGCQDFRWYSGVDTSNLIGTGDTLFNVCAGTYLARLTTNFGCNRYDTIIISDPSALQLVMDSVTAGCASPTGEASVSVSGGNGPYSYLWSNGGTTDTITGIPAGVYTVTVTDNNGCSDSASVTVNSAVGHIASATLINDALCFNDPSGSAFASQIGGTPPYTYTWSNGGATDTITNLISGSYIVTVTDASGCTDTASVFVDQPDSISFSFTEVPISCSGLGNDGEITVAATGGTPGYTYAWSNGATGTTITGLVAGTYCVTATDAAGCTDSACYVLDPPGSFTVAIIDSIDVSCFGGNDGSAEVAALAGGSGTYTFAWSNSASTAIANGLVAGSYDVTVTDVLTGCIDSASVTIDEPTQLVVLVDTVIDVNCFGGSDGEVCVTPSGGTPPYTYAWSTGSTSVGCVNNLIAGTYSVTITDANNCTAVIDTVVTEPATGLVAGASVVTPPTCNGDSATVTATGSGGSGVYTFAWPGGETTATVQLPAGGYCVTVSDGGVCTDTACVTVIDPTPVAVTIIETLPTCPSGIDGELQASGSGGNGGPYTFLWDDGSTNPTRTGLAAGNYAVTITDAAGCTAESPFTLIDPVGMSATFPNVNVSSCGTCNGSATISIAGGNAPFNFAWPSGSTGATGTGLCAGLNTVTVTDAAGCVDSFDINIGSQGADTVTASVIQNVTCNGGNDGAALATYNCSAAPCAVEWFDIATNTSQGTTDNISGLSAGDYYVALTNDSGCVSFDTITITEPTAVIASIISSSDVTCPGAGDGTAEAVGSGGAGLFTFEWPSGNTGAVESGLDVGTYCVTVTDASGCTDTACVTIDAPANSVSVAGLVLNNVSCNGGSDGSVTATITGGTPPYNTIWNGTIAADTLTNQPAGSYIVEVTDAGGCSTSDTVFITEPLPLAGSFSNVIDPSCPGEPDGEATISATGGTGPYDFAWPSGNTGTTEIGLSDGQYCVTITDANGCTDTACVIITDPTGIANAFTNVSNSSCTICDGTATANPSGGNGPVFTYLWSNGVTTDVNTTLCAGLNAVTITDAGGCSQEFNIPINADGADTVEAFKLDPSCGACDGEVYAVYNCGQPPCTVEWTNLATSLVIGTTDTVTGLCEGAYAVELTNGGSCVSIDTVTLVSPSLLDAGELITGASCFGSCDGMIALNVTGGSGVYTYNWSTTATTAMINNLCAGSYTVTISDGAGCDSVITFNVDEPSQILANATSIDASCFAQCDGEINTNPSGGAGGYTFNWSPVPANGNGTSQATGLCAGTYFLTITDANNCSRLDTFQIDEPTEIIEVSAVITDATCGICNGSIEPVYAGGAGGYTYSWSNGATTDTVTALCFGGYTLTVTDANGCTEDFLYPVSETGGPDISVAGVNVSVSGACDGSATATVISSLGTVTFNWSNGSTSASATNLCAGTYFVTSTDINGCSSVDTVTITEPTALQLSFNVTEISCSGNGCDGEIEALVTGGVPPYNFAWSNGETTALSDSLCVGTYVLTLTDNNGAQIIDSVELTIPQPFTIATNVADVSCPGLCDGSIMLNIGGGSPPYSYTWNTGDTTAMLTDLCAGLYSVTVEDTSSCSVVLDFNVDEPTPIVVTTVSVVEPDCGQNNGAISVTASGGNGGPYNFQWLDVNGDPLVPGQNGPNATNLAAGIYNVRVADANGCEDTSAVVLNNLNAPDITLDNITNVSCFGECDGIIETTVSGGVAPLSILWTNGDITETSDSLCAGNDTITVVDDAGCLAFDIYTITEPDVLEVDSFGIEGVICGSDCDGEIGITMTGGTEPYIFNWSDGATGSLRTGLCAGDYGLTVSDANGCTYVDLFTVAGPDPMIITVDSLEDATCNNTGDGSINITISGGTAPYSYQWNWDNLDTLTSQDLTNVLAGGYGLTVTDANGCTVSDSFNIGVQFSVSVATMDDFEVCPFTNGVTITGTQEGATSLRWLNADGTIAGNGLGISVNTINDTSIFILEGTTDVCVARDTLRIRWTPGPGIDAGPNKTIEPGDITTIGGNPTARDGVDVVWTPAENLSSVTANNPEANPLETTVYYVSATDEDGCFGLDSMTVTVEEVVDPVGGFSPNGDGVNDFFTIDRIGDYPNSIVQVFNRWGNLIYESPSGYITPWNGKYQGKDLPVGTYYYVIDLKDPNIKRLITGPVTILK